MKKFTLTSLFLMLAMMFTACVQTKPASMPAVTSTYSPKILTAVALTLTAGSPPTTTPSPTSTPTTQPTASPTPTIPIWTQTPFPTATPEYAYTESCNNSVYVKDVTVPNGTEITPGKTFKKTWQLKNSGTCRWTSDYLITFVSGFNMDGESTVISKYVAPGATANITVELTAPDVEGVFTGYWLLADENGTGFGQLINVQIVVVEED